MKMELKETMATITFSLFIIKYEYFLLLCVVNYSSAILSLLILSLDMYKGTQNFVGIYAIICLLPF